MKTIQAKNLTAGMNIVDNAGSVFRVTGVEVVGKTVRVQASPVVSGICGLRDTSFRVRPTAILTLAEFAA